MSTSCLFYCFLFSFNDAAPTEIYTLSLHDALPIFSVDSFPVGLSIGMSGVQTMIALFLFGIVSTLMTWIGFLLGRKVHGLLGVYSEMLGGSILCTFGLIVIFG